MNKYPLALLSAMLFVFPRCALADENDQIALQDPSSLKLNYTSPSYALFDEVAGNNPGNRIGLNFSEKLNPKSQWTLNIWGLSRHTQRPTLLNERNWGLGFRYWHSEHRFTEVNHVYNSFKGFATTVFLFVLLACV